MPFDLVAAISALISFVSLFLVVFQLHQNTEQRRLESILAIYDINQRLIALGFEKPELFKVLQDAPDVDALWERHYLQLWLNQIAVIHFIESRGLVPAELRKGFHADIADFLAMGNLQRHWVRNQQFYPDSLRKFVEAQVASESAKKNEPPVT